MKTILKQFIFAFLILAPQILGAQIYQVGPDIDGENTYDNSGSAVSINATGDRIAIGSAQNDGNGSNSGSVRIYEWNGSAWLQIGQDIDGEAISDYSGGALSINAVGDRVAIGAYMNDGNGSSSGHVRIYYWNGATWLQMGQDIDGEANYDQSGQAISMNAAGNLVAIGAVNNNPGGHVRVYSWDGSGWLQQGQDIDGEASNDFFGNAVSLNNSGNRLAVGGYNNDGNGSNSGHVRIYYWSGSTWLQMGQDIDGENAGDLSGWSLSLNGAGDHVVIGANGNDGNGSSSGHARIYYWNGATWLQMGQDIDGEASNDDSGFSVAINDAGNRIAIGARLNDGNGSSSGHVRIYYWNGSTWLQEGQDIDGEASGDYFGCSVSMSSSGNRIAIGAYSNDGNGYSSGHVRIFHDPNAIVNVGFEANDDLICLDDTVQFTDTSITNAVSWQWNFGDGQSSNLASPYHVYTQEGNYDVSLIIADSAGVLDSTTYFNYIHVIGPNSVSATQQDSVCLSGGAISLDVSAFTLSNIAYQINWSNGNNTPQISALNQGTYHYTLTVDQCVLQDTFTIGTGPNNNIQLQTYSDNVSCFGYDGTAGVSLINGNSFAYEDNFDNGNYDPNLWASVIGGSVSGGCGSQSGNYALYFNGTSSRRATTVPLNLVGTNSISFYLIIGTGSSPCENADAGEDVVLEYSANGSAWTNINTYYTNSYYNFTYLNVNLPAAAQTNSVQLRWRQPYFTSSIDNWSIDDINITGNNNNDFTFQWNDPQQQTTSYITGLPSGNYQVTVLDSLGCSGIANVTVDPFTPINVVVNTQDITCEGLNNGTATASVSGGNAPYTYQFSAGFSSDSVATSLASGPFYVNITDQDGCTSMSNFYIYDANVPVISLSGTDPSCSSGQDGSISSTINGGNAPFTYLWNDSLQQTTANASSLMNGSYTLTITDSLNCTYDSSITISNQFLVNVNSYPPTCYGFSDGSIAVDVQNGSNPTTSWSNGATADSISGLSGGSYIFSLTDSVLCAYTDTINIIDPDSLIVSAQISDVSCNYNNGAITVNTNGNSNSSNVLEMENNGYYNFNNIYHYISYFYPDEISFDLMSPDVSLNSNYFHSSFLVEDGSSDLVWFMMSVDESTSQPIMGPVVTSSVSGSVNSYATYNLVPFYYTPGDWYHVEFRNINYSSNTYDYYVNNQLILASIPFRQSAYNVDRVRISHYTPETVVSYFDNIDFSTNGTTIWGEDFEAGLPNWSYSTNYSNSVINANIISNSGVSYQWSNGDTTQTIDNLTPGTYTVNVSSSSNCFSSTSYTVADLGSPTISLSSTNATCLGSSDGSVNIGVTGGASPYTYSYTQGNTLTSNIIDEGAENGMGNFTSSGDVNFVTNTTFSHTGSSSYHNAYTNYNNNYLTCDTTFDFTNTTEAFLNFWHIAKTRGNDDYCYIEYSSDGGSTWSKIPSTNYNGSASTYTGTYPYFDEYSYSVWGSSSSPNNSWWQEENFDLAFLAGQANVKIRFYLYSDNLYTKYGWLIDDITVSANNMNDSVVYNVSSGVFPVTVTDANNCSVMDSILVGANPYNMSLSFTTTNASCSGASNGSVQVSVNGGNGPYDYSFSQGTNTNTDLINEDAENGLGGFVTSGNNLFYTTTYLSHSGNQSFFNDYNSYDYNYLTYDSDIDLSNATNVSLNFWQIAKTEGSYDKCYVQYSDDGGSNWYNIPYNYYNGNATNYIGSYPYFDEDSYSMWGTSNTTPNNTWWQEENFDLSFLSGENDVRIRFYLYSNSSYYRYGWLLDDIVLSVNNSQDSTSYNLVNGMVSVLVTDSTGCGVLDSVSIGVDSLFTASYQTTNITCFGENDGTINITPNGGTSPFTYSWSSSSSGIINYTEDFETGSTNTLYWPNYTGFIGASCGVYSGFNAMFFDGNGSRYISTAPTNISANSSISFYLLYGSSSNTCETVDFGEEVSLEYSLNGSTWYNINTYSLLSYQTGVYEYISESIPSGAQGSNVSIRIIQNNHSGSGTDNWSLDDITINFGGGGTTSSNVIDSLAAGNYTVTILDSAGCTISNTVSVVEPPQLYTNSFSNSNGNLCYGQSNGTANVTASGGVPPYSFSWSNGQNGNNISNLGAGNYTCVVTDSFNCAKNESVQITAPYLLNANINSYDISCFGGNNGALTVNISGGTSPYNVSWSNGQNGTVINNLSAGHYSAMITDFNSCNTQILDSITEPTEILIVINTVDATTGMNNGSAVALVSGGTPPYTYVWSNGGYNSSIFNLGAGVYNITVTDNNQCQKSNSAVINSVTDIADNLVLNDVTISPNPFVDQAVLNLHNYNGTYDLSLYNSIGKLTRSYKSVSGKFILYKNDLAPGVYLLTIDANGKSIEKKIVVD